MWQDIVLMVVTVVFGISMGPTISLSIKEKRVGISFFTLIPTILGVGAVMVCFGTLGLWFSLIANAMNCCLWTWLLILKVRFK